MGFDLWRLFAGVVLMQTMFNFCSYRNIKEEKNKEEAILIMNLGFILFLFFSMKTIMWVTEAKNENHGGQSINFQTTVRQNVNGPNHKWIKCTYPF